MSHQGKCFLKETSFVNRQKSLRWEKLTWEPTLNGYIYKTCPHRSLRGHWGRLQGTSVRARGWGVCREIVSPSNIRGYNHKVSPTRLSKHKLTRVIPVGIPKWMEENPTRLQSCAQNYRKLKNTESRSGSFPQARTYISIGCPMPNAQLCKYMYK